MKCKNCGSTIANNNEFCTNCGTKIERTEKKATSKAAFIIVTVLLIISLVLNVIALAIGGISLVGSFSNEARSETEIGYTSPEKAAEAFADALKKCDVNGIVSTFAVDKYCEHFNLERYLNVMRAFTYMNDQLPKTDDFNKTINTATRKNAIISELKWFYFGLHESFDGKSVAILNGDSTGLFLEYLSSFDFSKEMSEATFGSILGVNDFESLNISAYERNTEQIKRYLDYEDITSFAIEFDYKGDEYYIYLDVVLLDGKWYNLSMKSALGIVNGMDISTMRSER